MPNISFFIPAYNCAHTIAESVESIMAGNFIDGDELLIVNDYATDNTVDVLSDLKIKYPIITILTHKRNKGGAAARNTAVENANNNLLFCLDSDNVLVPQSIAPLKEYLLKMNADVASFQYQHFFSDDKQKPISIWSLPEGLFDVSLYYTGKNTPGQHGNYLFTKQSWIHAQGYAEGTGALDTWTFGLRQAITGAVAVVLKDTFYYHRLDHSTSYWMRDAEANLKSVSEKAAHALYPFFNRIDENYLNYMLGNGRYWWFYNLKNRSLKIVDEHSKDTIYQYASKKASSIAYPKTRLTKRISNKIKRTLNGGR
jgi:glycosyltransferase involved in cell wall biosynthesis